MSTRQTAFDLMHGKDGTMYSVSPDTKIADAIKIMCDANIGAIIVQEGDRYVGIWTERDLLQNALNENFNPYTAIIKDYMSTNLITAQYDENIYRLMDKFLGKRLRHLFITKEDGIIGFLSSGDVEKALLNDKTNELENLNAMVSWEYYSNWQWKKKK